MLIASFAYHRHRDHCVHSFANGITGPYFRFTFQQEPHVPDKVIVKQSSQASYSYVVINLLALPKNDNSTLPLDSLCKVYIYMMKDSL